MPWCEMAIHVVGAASCLTVIAITVWAALSTQEAGMVGDLKQWRKSVNTLGGVHARSIRAWLVFGHWRLRPSLVSLRDDDPRVVRMAARAWVGSKDVLELRSGSMRLEATHTTGSWVAKNWGSEPNLRAEIKGKLADQLAIQMRTRDLVDYVVTTVANGDTVITASVLVERTGEEK